MSSRVCTCVLTAFLALILLPAMVTASPEMRVSFTVSELTIGSDLNAVALFGGGAIAVGRAGTVAIAYAEGERLLERPVDKNLLDVSCDGQMCMAVGERGAAIIIDVSRRVLKPVRLSDDLRIIGAHGGRFYIASSKQVMEYSPESGISAVYGIEALGILSADRLYALSRDGVYYVEGGELKRLASGSYSLLAWFNGSLHALSKGGLYRILDNVMVMEGSYDGLASCGTLYLFSGSTVYRLPESGEADVYAVLPFKPKDAACRGDEVYAVGEKGYYARVTKNSVELLFAPPGRYVTASADSGTGYVAGDRVLSYKGGAFRIIEAPSGSYMASSASGGTLALLSRDRIILVSDAGVKALPYAVSGYNDIWLSGDTILLAGRGLIEVSAGRMSSREILAGAELYAVNGYGAAGKNVLALLASGSAQAVTVNVTLRGLDAIPCGLVAVGDSWLIAYRDGETAYYKVPGGEKLRSIAVRPDGAYALVGGAGGGLYIWDGYSIQQLPYRAPGEVTDIAWITGDEALIAAGGRLFLFRDLGHGKPSLDIKAPDALKLYNGSERVIAIKFNPVNGYSGDLEIAVIPEGLDGLRAELFKVRACVRPLCPAKVDIRVSAAPHTSGSGRITIAAKDAITKISVVVEPRARQPSGPANPLNSPMMAAVIIGILMLAITLMIAFRLLKGARRPPKPGEAGPGAEGAEPKGGMGEW